MAILHAYDTPREALAAALNGHPVGSDPLGAIQVGDTFITTRVTGVVLANNWLVLGLWNDGTESLAAAFRAAVEAGVIA